MPSKNHFGPYAFSLQDGEGNKAAVQGEGPLVVMYGCFLKVYLGNRLILENPPVLLQGLIRFTNRKNGVAAKLAFQFCFVSQLVVSEVMQTYAVPHPVFAHKRHQKITGESVNLPHGQKFSRIFWGH